VDHSTLSVGFAAAGFILYPTHYPETGCLAVLKAMAMGCVPVTSRFSKSALPLLTAGFDMGPADASMLTPGIVANSTGMEVWTVRWVRSVVDAVLWAQQNLTRSTEFRSNMRREIRKQATWKWVCRLLLDAV
jgi:glycosyltransferase involved in cell wall biosynthesis